MTDFLHDTFTDADGTLLTAHTGEIGATWTAHPSSPGQFTVGGNRVYLTTSGVVYASGVPPSADYDVEADVYIHSVDGSQGIFGRLSTSAVTGYFFRVASTQWQLYRAVAGAFTPLDSEAVSLSLGVPYRLRMELRGTTQRCFADDVLVCEAADTQIADAGRVGLRDTVVVTPTTGKHFDMIRAYTPDTERAIYPVLIDLSSEYIGPLRTNDEEEV